MSLSTLKNVTLSGNGGNNSQSTPAPMTAGNSAPPQQVPQATQISGQNPDNSGNPGNQNPGSPNNPVDKWAFLSDNPSQPNQNGGAPSRSGEPDKSASNSGENKGQQTPSIPTPENINAALSKANMLGNITQEQIAEAQQDPQKFMELLTQVGRNSAGYAASLATQGMQPYLDHQQQATTESAAQTANTRVKTDTVKSIIAADPVASDPKYAPVVNMVTERYMQTYPNASAQDIAAVAKDYLVDNFGISANSDEDVQSNGSGWDDIPGIA